MGIGMFDIMNALGKFNEVKNKVQEVRERTAKETTSAESGAGMVKATVNGAHQVIALDIDKTLFNPDEAQVLTDLVIAAINKAMAESDIKTKAEITKVMQGSVPNIPGLDISSLLG